HIPKDLHGNLTTVAQKRPQFAYSYQVVESDINGRGPNNDGLIQKGEHIDLLVTVKNVGEGTSTKNVVTLRELSHKEVFVEKGSQELGELAPGESNTVPLRFHVRNNIEANEFTVDLVITDLTYSVFLTDKLTFPILEAKTPEPLVEEPKTLVVIQDGTSIYGGQSIDAPVMNVLKRDEVFRSDASVSDWYRVKLSSGGLGWVAARDVAETDIYVPEEAQPEVYVQHKPPVIKTEHPSSPSHTLRTVVSGEVSDEDGVKYVYIMVNNDKVYLNTPENVAQTKYLKFKAEVPLKEGPNSVTIIARDASGLLATKSFVTSAKTALVKGIDEINTSELH
ncbi:MAG: hypothetical protein V3V54_01325, partial [Candidatus Brocadiales bacterium]